MCRYVYVDMCKHSVQTSAIDVRMDMSMEKSMDMSMDMSMHMSMHMAVHVHMHISHTPTLARKCVHSLARLPPRPRAYTCTLACVYAPMQACLQTYA